MWRIPAKRLSKQSVINGSHIDQKVGFSCCRYFILFLIKFLSESDPDLFFFSLNTTSVKSHEHIAKNCGQSKNEALLFVISSSSGNVTALAASLLLKAANDGGETARIAHFFLAVRVSRLFVSKLEIPQFQTPYLGGLETRHGCSMCPQGLHELWLKTWKLQQWHPGTLGCLVGFAHR